MLSFSNLDSAPIPQKPIKPKLQSNSIINPKKICISISQVMKSKKTIPKEPNKLIKKKKKRIHNKFQNNPTIKRILKQSEGEEEGKENSQSKKKLENNKFKSTSKQTKLLNGDRKAPKMKERMIVLSQILKKNNLHKKHQMIRKSEKK